MDTQLKANLETHMQSWLNANCEEGHWEGYIHTTLIREMANAAEQVFDASMNGQEYAENERGVT